MSAPTSCVHASCKCSSPHFNPSNKFKLRCSIQNLLVSKLVAQFWQHIFLELLYISRLCVASKMWKTILQPSALKIFQVHERRCHQPLYLFFMRHLYSSWQVWYSTNLIITFLSSHSPFVLRLSYACRTQVTFFLYMGFLKLVQYEACRLWELSGKVFHLCHTFLCSS